MKQDRDRANRGKDRDGVRSYRDGGADHGVWLLVVAVTLTVLAIVMVVGPAVRESWTEPAQPNRDDVATRPTAPRAGGDPVRRLPAPPARIDVPTPPSQGQDVVPVAKAKPAPAARGEAPVDEPAAARAAGSRATDAEERVGLRAFPPMGTDPPKPGIIVPDGFELQPGYVRHYQSTDDGRPLEPILMYHPDFQPVDERGEPIPIPEDRVVPPGAAPAELPIRILEIPDTELAVDPAVEAFFQQDR